MPKLTSFTLEIQTGERGRGGPLEYAINGFRLGFEKEEGGTGAGETITVTGSPDSFPHSLHLGGPEEGAWDIADIRATYFPSGEKPYTYHFGSVTLDDESDLNIWKTRPPEVFDV